MSNLFKLNLADLGKGLLVSILTAILLYAQTALTSPDFSLATINWVALAQIAITAGVAYLAKNLATSNQGNLLGVGDK